MHCLISWLVIKLSQSFTVNTHTRRETIDYTTFLLSITSRSDLYPNIQDMAKRTSNTSISLYKLESYCKHFTGFISLNTRRSSGTELSPASPVYSVNKHIVAHKSLLSFTETKCFYHSGLKCTQLYVMDSCGVKMIIITLG